MFPTVETEAQTDAWDHFGKDFFPSLPSSVAYLDLPACRSSSFLSIFALTCPSYPSHLFSQEQPIGFNKARVWVLWLTPSCQTGLCIKTSSFHYFTHTLLLAFILLTSSFSCHISVSFTIQQEIQSMRECPDKSLKVKRLAEARSTVIKLHLMEFLQVRLCMCCSA